MQIKGLNTQTASYQNNLEDVRKKDAIDDLFNLSSQASEDSPSIKLRLSSSLQRLQDEFSEEVGDFLKQHPAIKEHLQQVELPSNEYTRYHEGADLTLRKLKAYHTWQQIERGLEKSPEIAEHHPFEKIHKEGKDEAIDELFQHHHSKVQSLHEARKQNTPNYYYLFFPETYNFN